MSDKDEISTLEDRLTAFIHESYALALNAAGLTAEQIEDVATAVDVSLTNNFDWQGNLQTYYFTTSDGSDVEPVLARSLEGAALHIAERNGWFHKPASLEDTAETTPYELANEARQSYDEFAIQATEDAGIAKAIDLEEAQLLSTAGFVRRDHADE
ncbi:MAG: hypothetical protein BGP25_05625 [Lysobacterales bacterium 63-13]|nr:MAG: hypothetical protein BGP25_05625 [Xanthomonadales bacterium 63-13]